MVSLNDTDGKTPTKIVNRRVSFAEKVKLHQIDLVQVQYPDWPELDLGESEDSSDEDSSFLKLEADADKIVSSLGPLVIPELSSDEDEEVHAGSEEEQTMELTGPIREINEALARDQSTHQEQPAEESEVPLPQETNGDLSDDEESEMELTEPINKPHIDFDENPLPTEEETMDITKLEFVNVPPQKEIEPTEELTMDVTKQFELIAQPQDPRTSSPIQIPVLQPLTDDEEDEEHENSGLDENDEEIAMALTQQLTSSDFTRDKETRVSNPDQEAEALTAEQNEITREDSDHEQDMQLTVVTISAVLEQTQAEVLQPEQEQIQAPVEQTKETKKTKETKELESPLLTDAENEEALQSDIDDLDVALLPKENAQASDTVLDGTEKRAFQAEIERLPKRLHTQYVTSTTTIPLADVSMTSVDGEQVDVPTVSLTDFLTEIGIKFYDDLEFATDMSTKYRLSISENQGSTSPQDFLRANVHLPLLEVYELCSKELSEKIRQGMSLFEELKEETLENNPDLFKSYYRASFYDQMTMKSRFHTLKEYTRQQAKQIWYQWRAKLVENLLDVLKGNLEVLQADKSVIMDQISALDTLFRDIQQKHHAIRLEVLHFKDIQSRFQNLDADQIKSIKSKLTSLNQQLIDHKSKISAKEEELKAVQARIELRKEEISMLKGQILESEYKLGKTRHFDSSEIKALEFKSQIVQAGAGLKYVKVVRDQIYQFQFNSQILVTVDFSKPDDSSSITFLLVDDSESEVLHNEHLLLTYSQKLAEQTGFTNIFDSFVSFRKKWLKMTEIDNDIYQLSIRYPIKFDTESKDIISFNFDFYSFEKKTKAKCKVQIELDSILQYPNNVGLQVIHSSQARGADIRRQVIAKPLQMFRALTELNTRG